MNLLFTICGRAGSKGIKNKNMKEFLGVPLVWYTISAINLYKKMFAEHQIDVALNTDSQEMMELVRNNVNMDIFIVERKKIMAMDTSPKVGVIADTLKTIKNLTGTTYEMVVDLDITAPLRRVDDIKEIIEKKMKSTKKVVFSVTTSRRNPYFNMVKEKNGMIELVEKSNFVTRQQAPVIYDMNASLYAYDLDFLESGKMIFDVDCDIIKMKDTGVLDLDYEHDFELMEVIAKYIFSKYTEFGIIKDNINRLLDVKSERI